MQASSHRKSIFFFLFAVGIPSIALIFFTLRMISQERELAQKRLLDERHRLGREIGQNLLVRLEKIKLQAASAASRAEGQPIRAEYSPPGVVLVGSVRENKLLFPWDLNQRPKEFQKALSEAVFQQKIRAAEKAEFINKDFQDAARQYSLAMETAKEPIQKESARLMLARALSKLSQTHQALDHYRSLLVLPSELGDEFGIPLFLYAAGALLDEGRNYAEIMERVKVELAAKRWFSPGETYKTKDIMEIIVQKVGEDSLQNEARECVKTIHERILELEQGLALQRDFPDLWPSISERADKNEKKRKEASVAPNNESLWVAYGENPWLISLAPDVSGSQGLLIAVEANAILATMRSEAGFSKAFPQAFQLVTGANAEGESPGENFRGLKITFSELAGKSLTTVWGFRPLFYVLVLLTVLILTLFGVYLLWRDTRRELRMAEMRSQFVSSVSHELKTPLTAIRMFAETLRLGRLKNQQTQEEYLDTIVNESERLTRLLNNVLDFSNIEKGKKTYRFEPASLLDVLHAAARAMEYPLNQQGFILHVETAEGIPDVNIDRDALEQSILNLLHNAMKYSGDSRDIDLRLTRCDDSALIQVADRGIGIEPSEQKRIFEKFYRVPSKENERHSGTGLGLSLVDHIVKAHGGRIEVESEPGKGSTFTIYIPLERKP